MAQPGAARVVQVAVEMADAQSVERDAGLRGELPGGLAPGLAVLPAIGRNRPGATRSMTGRRLPSSSSIQACGSGAAGRVEGWYTRISSADATAALPSGTTAAD
jgi:hypothetical protein